MMIVIMVYAEVAHLNVPITEAAWPARHGGARRVGCIAARGLLQGHLQMHLRRARRYTALTTLMSQKE